MKHVWLLLLLCLTGCAYRYQDSCVPDNSCYIVFLVNAPHLNYCDNRAFLRTMVKHPANWSKRGDVGHAWIRLCGPKGIVEGGHSGELGALQPKYFEGVIANVEAGDPNPVSYLWESQKDGFFQWGDGGHCPNYAIKVVLTEEQYDKVYRFIEYYPFSDYALTGNQCASFVAQIAAMVGLDLECQVTLPIDRGVQVRGGYLPLWQDDVYSSITVATPDVLELSMRKAVAAGKAECVVDRCGIDWRLEDVGALPQRMCRLWWLW